jgi:long-chain acyl-CoA synthetase
LAHIFERQNVIGLLSKGARVYFASSGTKYLLADLSVIRPTLFCGVPKVYENVRDAVKRKMTGIKKTLFDAAMAAKIQDLETGCGYSPIWDKLIFSKTKAALGGRVRFCVSGGAPISKDTLQFVLCALGPVVQGYGATETSAASTMTMTFDLSVGPVGPPISGCVIRLVDVPDMNYYSGPREQYKDDKAKSAFEGGKAKNGGEVWIGGPSVSSGYYDPSTNGLKSGIPSNGMSKKTKEDFFQEDGWSWFKTGDIGTWMDNGTLKIVDRRKNMFKTSLGEYVPVEEVEKTYQDTCQYADFVFLPKETKVSYVALCVVVSDSIGPVMKWAKEAGVNGDETAVVTSDAFKQLLFEQFENAAKEKKLQRFMWLKKANIYTEYQPLGYQEEWVTGVMCANGHREQLLTATFKARRTQLDQYFAPAFPKIYPDRPADHIFP